MPLESFPRETPRPPAPEPPAIRQSASLPSALSVAVVFKERRYDTGGHKTWFFSNIHHVNILNGRLQLRRENDGLVFDVPYEDIQEVYTTQEGSFPPMVKA